MRVMCRPKTGLLAVQLMNVQGPMARRVADVRLGLRVLMGAHPRDPWSIDCPVRGAAAGAAGSRGRAARSRPAAAPIQRWRLPCGVPRRRWPRPVMLVEEACPPRYDDAIGSLAPPDHGRFRLGARHLLSLMMGADAMAFLNNFNETMPPLADAAAWSHSDGRARRHRARMESTFMADRPLLLSPTWTQLPFEHGFDLGDAGRRGRDQGADAPGGPGQSARAALGSCVPAGRDEATGLPIGGADHRPRLRDDLCL